MAWFDSQLAYENINKVERYCNLDNKVDIMLVEMKARVDVIVEESLGNDERIRVMMSNIEEITYWLEIC